MDGYLFEEDAPPMDAHAEGLFDFFKGKDKKKEKEAEEGQEQALESRISTKPLPKEQLLPAAEALDVFVRAKAGLRFHEVPFSNTERALMKEWKVGTANGNAAMHAAARLKSRDTASVEHQPSAQQKAMYSNYLKMFPELEDGVAYILADPDVRKLLMDSKKRDFLVKAASKRMTVAKKHDKVVRGQKKLAADLEGRVKKYEESLVPRAKEDVDAVQDNLPDIWSLPRGESGDPYKLGVAVTAANLRVGRFEAFQPRNKASDFLQGLLAAGEEMANDPEKAILTMFVDEKNMNRLQVTNVIFVCFEISPNYMKAGLRIGAGMLAKDIRKAGDEILMYGRQAYPELADRLTLIFIGLSLGFDSTPFNNSSPLKSSKYPFRAISRLTKDDGSYVDRGSRALLTDLGFLKPKDEGPAVYY